MRSPAMETPRDAERRISDSLLNTAAYLAVAAGYLTSILISGHVSLAGFAVLSLASLGWIYCFWRVVRYPDVFPGLGHPITLGLLAAALMALAAPWLGVTLDWLLPVVTVAVIAVGLPWRQAAGVALGLWLATALDVVALDAQGHTIDETFLLQNQVSLAVGFAFSFCFALVFHIQVQQRGRAEALVAELEAAQARLRASASAAEELAITRERNRMAREIHDTLGHYLTILTVKLETAIKLEEHADTRLREELVEARRVATECLAEVRRSVAALRPTDASATSLDEALRRLVAELGGATPNAATALDVEGPVAALTPELRVALYRCAQEALTNVRKHAGASKVLVRLRVDERQAELTVLDNGVSASEVREPQQPGFGLLGMRERIELLGGTASAGPEPGHGWRVAVVVPTIEAAACIGGGQREARREVAPVEG